MSRILLGVFAASALAGFFFLGRQSVGNPGAASTPAAASRFTPRICKSCRRALKPMSISLPWFLLTVVVVCCSFLCPF